MTKKGFLIFALTALISASFYAAAPTNYQDFELDSLLHNIEKPGSPLITDNYIIFTAEVHNRFVGIAFDFENYQIIHPFQILNHIDEEGQATRQHMFYCYKRQHKFTTIRYRLVIDGLWTTDPLNPIKEYDENVNLYFSKVEDPYSIQISTQTTPDNTVHFIYKGEKGQEIRLAGNFTAWDPWIYTMKETKPGLYELELPLPTGKYYYNYYVGLNPMLDNTNPQKAYTSDGRSASVIVVN